MAFGLLPEGFVPKTLEIIKAELEAEYRAAFGAGIPLAADVALGKLLVIQAEREVLLWELMVDINDAFNPDSATGTSQDRVAAIIGIRRLGVVRSTTTIYAAGVPTTVIGASSLFAVQNTLDQFRSIAAAVLSGPATVALTSLAQTTGVATGTTGAAHGLSSGDRVFIDDAVVTQVDTVTIDTVVDDTLYTVTINGVAHTFTSDGSATDVEIRDGLVSAINGGAQPVTAAPVTSSTFTITADVSGTAFTITVGTNLSSVSTRPNVAEIDSDFNGLNTVTATPTGTTFNYVVDPATITPSDGNPTVTGATPIALESVNTGAVGAPANSLTVIVNAITGLDRVENDLDAVAGRDVESDLAFRDRRDDSVGFAGATTVPAIRARIRDIDGVIEAKINENDTDFPISDNLTIVGVATGPGGSFDVAGDVRLLFETGGPNVTFSVAGSTGNDGPYTLVSATLVGNNTRLAVVENVSDSTIDGSVVAETIRPHSFEAVVDGGDDDDIANVIFQLGKAAGIASSGATVKTDVDDGEGNLKEIRHSRPQGVEIFVEIDYTKNPEETFPADGEDQMSAAVLAHGNSLQIGDDVIIDIIEAIARLSTTGIKTLTARIDVVTPALGTIDIPISDRARSRFDSSRITVTEV